MKQKDLLAAINAELEKTEKTETNIGYIKQLERSRENVARTLSTLQGTTEKNFSQDILSAVNVFSGGVNSLLSGINKWIDFNTRMQTIQVDAIKLGWENISSGQTPYLTKTLDIMSNYTKQSLENQAASTKALYSTVGTLLGGVIGGGIGLLATGGSFSAPLAILGAGIVNQVLSGVFEMKEKEKEQELLRIQQDTSLFSTFKEFQMELRNMRLGIGTFLTNKGINSGDYLGGSGLDDTKSVEQRMRVINEQFAGIKGFDMAEQNKFLVMAGMTKQFTNQSNMGTVNMGRDVGVMSQMTGLGKEEILQYITEMRIRLNTPLDQLTNKFFQLVDISDKFSMPLKQVMSDMMELSKANQKFHFSQNELTGLYVTFIDEIKKGTVSMGDLQRIIRGLSETPMDKAIGIGALISSANKSDVLKNVKGGNTGEIGSMLDALTGSGVDAGMLLKLISNPTADKNEYMQGFMQDQGISQGQLEKWKVQLPKLLIAVSKTLTGSSGSSGYALQQYMFEQFADKMGESLPADFYSQGKILGGIEKLGTTGPSSISGVTKSFEQTTKRLTDIHDRSIEEQLKTMETLLPTIDKYNKYLQEGKSIYEAYALVLPEVKEFSKGFMEGVQKNLKLAGILKNVDISDPTGKLSPNNFNRGSQPMKVQTDNYNLHVVINENQINSSEDRKTIQALKELAKRYK